MGSVTIRNSRTSRGFIALSTWNDSSQIYSLGQINLGTNPNSRLEVVSVLNSFNLAKNLFHFNYPNSTGKFNPKVHFGTIQSIAVRWNYDYQTGQKNGLPNLLPELEKSGSWIQKSIKFF